MATRPKAVIESRNGEKFSPITIAKNVLTDDGQNLHDILSDRKEDMMTPTIENSSSMFKVGQGDNVDYSENVVDGAYESCVLKGRSLVNIHKRQGYTLEQSGETQEASKYENIIAGDNCISFDMVDGGSYGWGSYVTCGKVNLDMLKPNTKYLVYFGTVITPSKYSVAFRDKDSSNLLGAHYDVPKGQNYAIITTVDEIIKSNQYLYISYFQGDTGHYEFKDVIVTEYQEGMENLDIPYFEGMCDSKSPILSNVGKNLINALNCSVRMDATILSKEQNCITFKAPKAWAGLTYHLNLKPNTTYTFSFERDSVDTKGYVRYKTGSGWSDGHGGSNKHTFTTDGLGAVMFTIESSTVRDVVTVKNIMIEEDTTKNLYEPHKLNTTTFDQKDGKTIALRSLPNGVCDTLNVETGECVQNVVDIVFDGTENWTLNNWGTDDNFCSFEISSLDNTKIQNVYKKNQYIDFYCDTFKVLTNCKWNYMSEKHIRQWSDGNRTTISVIIPKTELMTYDVTGFVEYLTKNNIRINIRANNPIISTVDIQGFPYAYTNGHVQLSSGSIEQSLTPKVEYSVVTNRNGQIRSNQKMVERHQKQLDHLQAMILTNLVNTQYEQTLTNLKYDLKNVREEVK